MGTSEHRKPCARALAFLVLFAVASHGCGETTTEPTEKAQPVVVTHPAGTYTKPGRNYPRLIVWTDGRFDCIVDGEFWCPWNGSCCENDPTRYPFFAVFSGTGATTRDTLDAVLLGVYFRSPPDTIAVTEQAFRADWNGAGWELLCSITAACGEPQTASWLYTLKMLP